MECRVPLAHSSSSTPGPHNADTGYRMRCRRRSSIDWSGWPNAMVFEVQSLGIDPDPRAISYARQLGDGPALSFEACHSSDLVTRGASFDVVLSNHVLHHLTSDQLRVLVNDSETLEQPRSTQRYQTGRPGMGGIPAGRDDLSQFVHPDRWPSQHPPGVAHRRVGAHATEWMDGRNPIPFSSAPHKDT